MQGINEQLNQAIKDEVANKKAMVAAKALVEIRRPNTRAKIEDLKELAALEKDWYS